MAEYVHDTAQTRQTQRNIEMLRIQNGVLWQSNGLMGDFLDDIDSELNLLLATVDPDTVPMDVRQRIFKIVKMTKDVRRKVGKIVDSS